MPVERLREQFMPDAQMFFALGRGQQPAKSQPKDHQPRSEVISIGSTVSTVSSASTSSTTASSAAPPGRRARPIIYSSEEEGSEYEEARENLSDNNDHDSEIEIIGETRASGSQLKTRSNQTGTTGLVARLPNLSAESRPLQSSTDMTRTHPASAGSQVPYKSRSSLPGSSATPIHIPSNQDLRNFESSMRPTYFDNDRTTIVPAPIPGQPVYIPSAQSQRDPEDDMTAADTEKALRDLISGNLNDDEEAEIDIKDKIVEGFKDGIKLLDHQVVGRKWMTGRECPEEKKYGGLLADDMGLGKTIQTLTRIVDNPATKDDRDDGWSASTLIICPLALVGQWADEIKKMTKLSVIKHQGTSRTTDPLQLRRHNVVVTTYDTVKSEHANFSPEAKNEAKKAKSKGNSTGSDSDSDEAEHFGRTVKKPSTSTSKSRTKSALYQVKWFRIVLDEAHTIKKHTTKGAIACCALEGRFKWCLTGTPLQNDATDLYSLLKFLGIRPWHQYDKFSLELGKPLRNGRGAGKAMKKLQIILKNIMLRRRKDDTLNGKKLLDLPKRTVEVVSCPFDASERAFYISLETKMDQTLEKILESNATSKYISVLVLLLRLRQACNHPLLVTKDYKKDLEAVDSQASKTSSDVDANDLVAAFGQMGVTRKCQMCLTELNAQNTGRGEWSNHCMTCAPLAEKAALMEAERPTSAKIRMILKLLQDIDDRSDGKEKTIIFSQFTTMLDLIMPFLKENGIRFTRYDGSMSPVDREAALAKIRDKVDIRVILISFKAGSTGLNLTACNNVILVDLWWNPALEDQAFDRAHRFGQKRDVNIYKLKIDETVEERILLLQDKKRALAQAALSGDKLKNMKLGMDDLLALFRHSARDDDSDDEHTW